MIRARIVEGLIAALATVLAAWPITTLLVDREWLRPVLLVVLLQAGIGMASRAARAPRAVTVAAQVAAVLTAVALTHLRDQLAPSSWSELPAAINDLLVDASTTMTTYAAPAPATPGITFALLLLIPVAAVLVDALSVTFRMPAAAGLPLLGVFLMSTSNTGGSLNPVYFVLLAAAWLMMLARGGLQQMRRWSSAEAYSRTPERLEDRFGLTGYASVARWMGLSTLVLALLLPALIPHLPPRYLTDGLARSQGARHATTGTVGFTDSLDLTLDLNSTNQTPVLHYTTADPTPPPVRVLTMSLYSDGSWVRADPAREVDGRNGATLDRPAGMSPDLKPQTLKATFTTNGVEPPYVGVQSPLAEADFGRTTWTYDPASTEARVQTRPQRYETSYLELPATARPTQDHQVNPPVPEVDLRLDPRSRNVVTQTAQDVVGARDSDFDKAIKIQTWLRDPVRFTYSLTLAPTRNDSSGRPLDPISNFLATRQGYCTQFATTMVMMARSQGIPARVAVGFLPGTQDASGGYQVVAADAHAWPELYFPGLGWTRFEPTPGSRSGPVPDYADVTGALSTGNANQEPSVRSSRQAPTADSSSAPASAAPVAASSSGRSPLWSLSTLGWVLLVLAIGGAGAVVLPLLARWRREQYLHSTAHDHDRVEGEWRALQSRLHDLGIDAPASRTPRQLERYYRQHTTLAGEGRAALHHAVQTLEASRYAPPSDHPRSIQADSEQIVDDVLAMASLPVRVSAALFPRTGREALRRGVGRALRAPLVWLAERTGRD